MNIIYTMHALEKMRQRNIVKEKKIERCIERPDKLEELEDLYRCIKRLNDRLLITIYKKLDDKIVIITAFKTSKTRKYLS